MTNIAPPSCPECEKPLSGYQLPQYTGGSLYRCFDCRVTYVVTRLPRFLYAQVDATIGFWFEDISKVDEVAIDLTLENQIEFERLLAKNEFNAAREMVEDRKTDLARMVREIAFFQALKKQETVLPELQPTFASAISFLLKTDPLTYQLPCDVELPAGRYETENPYEYLPAGSTLVVFHPTLGMYLRDNFRNQAKLEVNKLKSELNAQLLSRMKEPLIADHTFHRWQSVHWLFNLG